jgi:hypothetical protein
MAEMLEGKKAEFASLIGGAGGKREVAAAIDRLVCFGGWADKYAQVLGCNNPVAGPYYNFTVPEPTGVVGVIAPDEPALLGLVSLIAPPLCAGNTVVALAGETNPLVGAVFGEVCATSDIPPGVVNILTGLKSELVPQFASAPGHRLYPRRGCLDRSRQADPRGHGRQPQARMCPSEPRAQARGGSQGHRLVRRRPLPQPVDDRALRRDEDRVAPQRRVRSGRRGERGNSMPGLEMRRFN